MGRSVGRGSDGGTSEGRHWLMFSRVQNRDYSSVRTHYSMAVGNDEGLKLDGTDDEERLKTSMKRLKEGRGKEGSNVVEVDKRIVWGLFAQILRPYIQIQGGLCVTLG